MTYSEKLKDPRWQKKRLQIFERDKWSCQICSNESDTLNVHHLEYARGLMPWEYNDEELITVCENDHELISSLKIPKAIIATWVKGKGGFRLILMKDDGNSTSDKLKSLFREYMFGICMEASG